MNYRLSLKLHIARALLWQLLPATLLLPLSTSHAGFVETFDNSNDGDWHLTTNPAMIESDGGNPGEWLHATADAATPTWYVPYGTANTHFLGNYAAWGVEGMSFDVNIISGSEVPDRNATLDLKTTLGTGDFTKGVEAYYIGRNISTFPIGWRSYNYPLDASSPTIPPGWVVLKGDGGPGTDADWQALMQDVETLGLELGTPGYFYPFSIWDLGLDNCRIARQFRGPSR